MTEYVSEAFFVYTQAAEHLCKAVKNNQQGCSITLLALDFLLRQEAEFFNTVEHVVVAGAIADIKIVLNLAMQYDFSVGLLASGKQKGLQNAFDLPKNIQPSVELALKKDPQWLDLILCNEHIVLYKASVGWIPLLDTPIRGNHFQVLYQALKKLHCLRLRYFKFITASQQQIKTAASGCMIAQPHQGNLAAKFIADDRPSSAGGMSLLIVSPFSVVEYIKFLFLAFKPEAQRKQLPAIIGYIKSSQLDIESSVELDVLIDGETVTKTPIHCVTLAKAIRINAGPWLTEENKNSQPAKERIKIANLPDEKECIKITEKEIPFFSYASEARFRDLFLALREDASINGIYLVLMLLSTFLATIGLYLDSVAVIIGAMLLAPLMAPIVSAAMGLLRQDQLLLNRSMIKIVVGVTIALLASALISLVFSYKPLTDEVQGRLNPTLLDLAVAIVSGVAAAYSKSHKEIAQSLAGVAIAVALVPPLSVAGIGIGKGDFHFFLQAFLLFSTNLVGIVLAALFTFRALGYSPVFKSRRGFGFVVLTLLLIMAPLYLSYQQIITDMAWEKSLKTERFLVNGKYIIIQDVKLGRTRGKEVVVVDILVRETLDRQDLYQLKMKIEHYFDHDMAIRTRISYIL